MRSKFGCSAAWVAGILQSRVHEQLRSEDEEVGRGGGSVVGVGVSRGLGLMRARGWGGDRGWA